MEKQSTFIDRIESAANALMGRRGRVALLIAGLATAPAACKLSLSLDTNFDRMDALRNGALDGGRTRHISVSDADATVLLGSETKEIKKTENETVKSVNQLWGSLYVFTYSPLRNFSETKVYKLTEENAPWTFLVQESPRVITLRTKCDTLVLKFHCDDLTNVENRFCRGEEVAPNAVRKLCADGHFCPASTDSTEQDAGVPETSSDAKTADSDADAGTDGSAIDAQPNPDALSPDAPEQIFNNTTGEVDSYMPADVKPKVDDVMPSAQKLRPKERAVFARRIVTDKHRAELEEFLRGYEGNTGNDLNTGLMDSVTRFLLAVRPGIIPVVKRELEASTRDSGVEVIEVDGDAGPEADKDSGADAGRD